MSQQDGLEIHLARVREEHSYQTQKSHKSRLSYFIEWFEMEGMDDLNELSGREIIRYRDWRRMQNGQNPEDVPIARSTVKTALDPLGVYLRAELRPYLAHIHLGKSYIG